MSIDDTRSAATGGSARPPVFNVPTVVLVSLAVFAAIHALRSFVLTPAADDHVIVDFSFIPGCYAQDCVSGLGRDAGALIWSPLTHALLHADWTHFGLNAVWMLAFGTPVARRLGALRFLVFSAVGALAGALLFYLVNPDLIVPVIGASGIVSAMMGAACRFAFGSPGRRRHPSAPLAPVTAALADRTVLFFILFFFGTNFLAATGLSGFLDGGAAVAWEAHVGGFVFGFLALRLFDRKAVRGGAD